jgi:hypothetical protein
LVLEMAQENRSWGYKRMVVALENLGHKISRQAVANILSNIFLYAIQFPSIPAARDLLADKAESGSLRTR